jgi:hypothetical protein
MKKVFIVIYLLFINNNYSQNDILWDGKYQLQLSDFQSAATQIGNSNTNNLFVAAGFEFFFTMSNIEFMFTKNFNSKVNNTFKRQSSSMVAVDQQNANNMLGFVQYQFDLSELYARKLRKKIFEEKKVLSDFTILKSSYDNMQKSYVETVSKTSKDTDLGNKKSLLKSIHDKVLSEIVELSEYCKECKAPKKIK